MRDYFLVLARFGIVAQDIAATLEERGLGAPLISLKEEDALAQLSGLDPGAVLRMAVIQRDRDSDTQEALKDALKRAGCTIIWLENSPGATTDEADQVLPLPFFTEDLEQVLARTGLSS